MFRTGSGVPHLGSYLVGATSMLFSGIDLHKHLLVIHTLDADGATTPEAEFKSDRAAVTT